jgi:glycine amidinotransferase|tara:strand:+ start:1873 stop:2940 length:1068 start_codon:yes stop_codon:yes gene_type:complete
MIYTEFDPLKEVIVGDSYAPGDLDHLLPADSKDGFNKILEETKQDYDKLAQLLQSHDVKVHRPEVYKFDHEIKFSEFDVNLPIAPMVPRDAYLVMGNTVLQTYTSLTDRYFDSLSYYHIFKDLFDRGCNWVSQPAPMLKNLNQTENWFFDNKIYHKKLPDKVLWHLATMFKAGDAVIYNPQGPGTPSGLDWVQRNLPDTRFIKNTKTVFQGFGHIDHGFILIDDETVIHAGIEWVPEVLRNKKLIDIKSYLPPLNLKRYTKDYLEIDSKYNVKWIEKYLENWKGYNQEICFDLNVLILDSKNILWGREIPELFRYLETFGIESHVCDFRHYLFWEGGIHCATLDTVRDGKSRSII